MKKILLLAAMLSIMLFSVGSAYAVLGTPDDVPGQDIVVPIVCEANPDHSEDTGPLSAVSLSALDPYSQKAYLFPAGNTGVQNGTLNTLWAIAEVLGQPVNASVFVFNSESQFVADLEASWTPNDVVANDCQALIGVLTPSNQVAMARVVFENGNPEIIYAGYVIYQNLGWPGSVNPPVGIKAPTNQFVSWVYQVDLPNGFAAGFDGYDVEFGVDTPAGFPNIPSDLDEAGGSAPVSAAVLMPRYFYLNTDPGTFNWWYILKGGPVTATHNLDGVVCNEEEDCLSMNIPVPYNFNIIDASHFIPAGVFHTGTNEASAAEEDPTAEAAESNNNGGGFAIFSTKTGLVPGFFNPVLTQQILVSTLGWSYQRAQTGSVISNWDVIHPMHALRED